MPDSSVTRPHTLDDVTLRLEADPGRMELMRDLIEDLDQIETEMQLSLETPLKVAQAVETAMVKLLDILSPEIRFAIAHFQRYQAAPKIGDKA